MNSVPKDCLDREIRVGDICVYPVRRGSSMWMNRITVQRISNANDTFKLHGIKDDGYQVSVSSLDRVALIGRDNMIPFMGEE